MDLSDVLSSVALPERTCELCLRGDLQAQVEDAERELQAVQRTDVAGLGESLGGSPALSIAQRIEDLREQMRGAMTVFRLRGLPRSRFRELVDAHPPREGEKTDEAWGWNTATFYEPLIRACTIDPTGTDDQWRRLFDSMTDGQFADLAGTALTVCRAKVDVPFSQVASAILRRDGATSKPPPD